MDRSTRGTCNLKRLLVTALSVLIVLALSGCVQVDNTPDPVGETPVEVTPTETVLPTETVTETSVPPTETPTAVPTITPTLTAYEQAWVQAEEDVTGKELQDFGTYVLSGIFYGADRKFADALVAKDPELMKVPFVKKYDLFYEEDPDITPPYAILFTIPPGDSAQYVEFIPNYISRGFFTLQEVCEFVEDVSILGYGWHLEDLVHLLGTPRDMRSYTSGDDVRLPYCPNFDQSFR